jgi:uracil-DNA glycosylase family 4
VLHSSFNQNWRQLNQQIVACTACDRLIAHCRSIAATKRLAYRDWTYWGRPVPNFGDPQAELLIVGLAPGAHGANRTGRVFTGDSSGDWLFRALHRAGFASQPHATSADDGLELFNCAITGAAHCAPPDNKPTPAELANCRPWLAATLDAVPRVRVFLALGSIGWREILREIDRRGWRAGPLPKFGHGAVVELAGGRRLVGCYHPSRQNTNTGRLTERMLDDVFCVARKFVSVNRSH